MIFSLKMRSNLTCPLFLFFNPVTILSQTFFFFSECCLKYQKNPWHAWSHQWLFLVSGKQVGSKRRVLGTKPTTWELVEKLPVDRPVQAHSGWTVWHRAKVWWKEEGQSPWAGSPGVTIMPTWPDTWLFQDSVSYFANWGNEMLWIKCFLPKAPPLPSSHFSKMNFSEAYNST